MNGFASKLEAALYQQLWLRQCAGEIRELKCQESVWLTEARIEYKADFSFFDVKQSCKVWAEAKGFETAIWKLKLRLYRTYGPGPLELYYGTAKNVWLAETIIPRLSSPA
jgi:hypothetical protein